MVEPYIIVEDMVKHSEQMVEDPDGDNTKTVQQDIFVVTPWSFLMQVRF